MVNLSSPVPLTDPRRFARFPLEPSVIGSLFNYCCSGRKHGDIAFFSCVTTVCCRVVGISPINPMTRSQCNNVACESAITLGLCLGWKGQ